MFFRYFGFFCFVGSSLFLGNMGTYSGQILLNRLWLFRVCTCILNIFNSEKMFWTYIIWKYMYIVLILFNLFNILQFFVSYLLHVAHYWKQSYLTAKVDWFHTWWIFKICFRYSVIRFEEYFARKNEFLSLQWIFPSKSSWKSWCIYNIAIIKWRNLKILNIDVLWIIKCNIYMYYICFRVTKLSGPRFSSKLIQIC